MSDANPQEQLFLTPRIRYRVVDEEGVLVHLESDRVIVVNKVGLFIVEQLATPKSRLSLANSIASHFEIDVEQAKKDLDLYIAELDRERVLERHHVPD